VGQTGLVHDDLTADQLDALVELRRQVLVRGHALRDRHRHERTPVLAAGPSARSIKRVTTPGRRPAG
jgi:hypothetical protein